MELALLILSWPHHAFNPRKKPEDSAVEVETTFGAASYGALGCESKQLVHAVRLSKDHLERTSRVPLEQINTTHITRICNLLCNDFLLLLNYRSNQNYSNIIRKKYSLIYLNLALIFLDYYYYFVYGIVVYSIAYTRCTLVHSVR